MIPLKTKVTMPAVAFSGFETPLAEEEAAIQASVHRFAKDVLRPLGRELDRMSAEEVIAPGSPYYSVFGEFAKLGLDPSLLASLPPEMAVRIESLIGEELGWGDAGLAVSLGAAGIPQMMAEAVGKSFATSGARRRAQKRDAGTLRSHVGDPGRRSVLRSQLAVRDQVGRSARARLDRWREIDAAFAEQPGHHEPLPGTRFTS